MKKNYHEQRISRYLIFHVLLSEKIRSIIEKTE